MAIWKIDVPVYASAYIVADSEEDARAKLLAHFGDRGTLDLEVPEGDAIDFEVTGRQFDDPDFPEISLAPSMTVYPPKDDAPVEYMGGDEDEED